ncbi:hypothetical protein ACOCJ5_03225 [Knoellia sp. CPCC 206450]|uniref:hypothetical protein n=1 Tax=Knoellia tibetensis TaxID=3404798 RepID=UPI003B4339B7
MSKTTTIKTLPPKHNGYRAAVTGRYVTTVKGRKLPKPPTGEGGGSKSTATSDG